VDVAVVDIAPPTEKDAVGIEIVWLFFFLAPLRVGFLGVKAPLDLFFGHCILFVEGLEDNRIVKDWLLLVELLQDKLPLRVGLRFAVVIVF